MIARQGDDRGWPFVGCKSLEHALRVITAVDIVAQENRHRMIERPTFEIRLDTPSHVPEQVVTTMYIADAVNACPIGYSTCSRNRWRSVEGLQERFRPPREFRSRYFCSRGVHSGRSKAQASLTDSSSCGRTNRAATDRHRDRCAHHLEQHANASGGIKSLKRAHEICKRSREDTN